MSVLVKLTTRARRHGPLIVAVCVVACGHVGLDLQDHEVGDGDGDGDTGSGATAPMSGGRDSSGGAQNASGGAQINSGGTYSSGGNWGGQPGSGGDELGGEGGELNEGGAGPGGEDSCEPDCACSSDDSSDSVCSIECLQSPCNTSCEVSCEIVTLETANTQLLIDCQSDATCETTGPSAGGDLDVTCTGGGSCIVNCGSAQACSTSCEGSGPCELNCDNAETCHLDCIGGGDCKVLGGLLEDITCPLNAASECENAVVCGPLCE